MSSSGPLHRVRSSGLLRRLVHFWVVWSVLLTIHEGGHALLARRQGGTVERVTVGAGPVLWSESVDGTELVLRLIPLVGLTQASPTPTADGQTAPGSWAALRGESVTILGGVAATLTLALLVAAAVLYAERSSRRRWRWGRIVVADALVLTVFNFLPVPPLDGGRALLGALTALRGAPLAAEALFWVQVGGLGIALVPMLFWTRWTSVIDRAALHWWAPEGERPR